VSRFPLGSVPQGSRVYVAGPMRGRPLYNFPRFHEEAATLEAAGYVALDPAAADEADGFDPSGPLPPCFMHEAGRRDMNMLLLADAVVVLEGWKESSGAALEVAVARWLGLPVFYASPLWLPVGLLSDPIRSPVHPPKG
jgi:hypothetical protein